MFLFGKSLKIEHEKKKKKKKNWKLEFYGHLNDVCSFITAETAEIRFLRYIILLISRMTPFTNIGSACGQMDLNCIRKVAFENF